MTDISAIGARLTIGNEDLGSVTFNDLSDSGTPIEFERIESLTPFLDLNNELCIGHRQITPAFSISVIPGSKADRQLRALLLSSVISNGGDFKAASDIAVSQASLYVPGRGTEGGETFFFYEGYLVGGTPGLNVSNDGRWVSNPYRFVFKSLWNSRGDFTQTEILKNDSPIDGLYYARISGSTNARMISHPIESGAQIFDQKYIEPEKVSVSVKIPMAVVQDKVSEFFDILKDRSVSNSKTPYSVNTKSETYENLSLIGISHDENPDVFDLIDYHLTFQELMFSTASGSTTTSDPSNMGSHPTQPKTAQSSRPTT